MGDVADRDRRLLDQIHELRLLREAQDPNGARYLVFQRQIEVLTDELTALRSVAPQIERLDELDADARRHLVRCREDVDDPWRPLAGWTGVLGWVLMLLSLWLDLSAGWVVSAVALVAVAVAALLASCRYRQDAEQRVAAAQDRVMRIAAERAGLLGQGDAVPAVPSQVSHAVSHGLVWDSGDRPALPGGGFAGEREPDEW